MGIKTSSRRHLSRAAAQNIAAVTVRIFCIILREKSTFIAKYSPNIIIIVSCARRLFIIDAVTSDLNFNVVGFVENIGAH